MSQAPTPVPGPRIPASERTTGGGVWRLERLRFSSQNVGGCQRLMTFNPRVKPNSTTVLSSLRHLRQTAKCADNGVRLVTRYKRLYGDGVDDERVRLRLAVFAIKQGNPTAFRRALASASTPTGLRWNGAAMARRRARLIRKEAPWLIMKGRKGADADRRVGP